MKDLRRHFENALERHSSSPAFKELLDKCGETIGAIIAELKNHGFSAEIDESKLDISRYDGQNEMHIEGRLVMRHAGRRTFEGSKTDDSPAFKIRAERVQSRKGLLGNIGIGERTEAIELIFVYFDRHNGGWIYLDMNAEGAVPKAAEIMVERHARRAAENDDFRHFKDAAARKLRDIAKTQKPGW